MMKKLQITTEGDHALLSGNTYPHRLAIKRLGGCWNRTREAWVVRDIARAQDYVSQVNSAADLLPVISELPPSDTLIAGSCDYAGRRYYIAGKVLAPSSGQNGSNWGAVGNVSSDGNGRCEKHLLLISQNGRQQFWASAALIGDEKHFSSGSSIAARLFGRRRRKMASPAMNG